MPTCTSFGAIGCARFESRPTGARREARIDIPGEPRTMLDHIQAEYQVNVPVADLLYADLYGRVKDYLLSGVYLGGRTIDGEVLDHLSFETTGATGRSGLSRATDRCREGWLSPWSMLRGNRSTSRSSSAGSSTQTSMRACSGLSLLRTGGGSRFPNFRPQKTSDVCEPFSIRSHASARFSA